MIGSLSLTNVGPAERLSLKFGERLNLLTGDNGLGKSFLLDVAWWAQTGVWPHDLNEALPNGFMALPREPARPASMRFDCGSYAHWWEEKSVFQRKAQGWSRERNRPGNAGLVIYAQPDGGFSVWDFARNPEGQHSAHRTFVFSNAQVWYGLRSEREREPLCEGLLRDWATWIRENGEQRKLLELVLGELSPEGEAVALGPLLKIDLSALVYPTLRFSYGDVPLIHLSAGMRRIISLAYLLVWTWTEHQAASALLGEPPTRSVTFLIDEIEAHLHPRWQRRVLSGLLRVARHLSAKTEVQLLVATHSPLVMASVETEFRPHTDRWFDLDLVKGKVVLTQREFQRLGGAERWLLSDAFDLTETGDPKIEGVLNELEGDLRQTRFGKQAAVRWDKRLRTMLGESHPYWSRWRTFVDLKGWKL